jgi:hypothetical protein
LGVHIAKIRESIGPDQVFGHILWCQANSRRPREADGGCLKRSLIGQGSWTAQQRNKSHCGKAGQDMAAALNGIHGTPLSIDLESASSNLLFARERTEVRQLVPSTAIVRVSRAHSSMTAPLRTGSGDVLVASKGYRQLSAFTCPFRCLGPELATHFQWLRRAGE